MSMFSFGGGGGGSGGGGSSSFGSYFWPAAIMATTQLVGGLFGQKSQEKEANRAREEARAQDALNFERQKELIALRGAGGGGGGPFTGITDAQKVQAMQTQQQLELDSLNQLITAYQRAVLK